MRFASFRLLRLATVLILLLFYPRGLAAEAILLAKMGGGVLAYVLSIGNTDRIVIRRSNPRASAELSLFCQDAEHGVKIENYDWSYGGSYLVFFTSSGDIHRTYVFSTAHWAFLVLDEVVAPVTSADFTFPDSTHVEVEIRRPGGKGSDHSVKKVVDLDALPWPAESAENPAPESNSR